MRNVARALNEPSVLRVENKLVLARQARRAAQLVTGYFERTGGVNRSPASCRAAAYCGSNLQSEMLFDLEARSRQDSVRARRIPPEGSNRE